MSHPHAGTASEIASAASCLCSCERMIRPPSGPHTLESRLCHTTLIIMLKICLVKLLNADRVCRAGAKQGRGCGAERHRGAGRLCGAAGRRGAARPGASGLLARRSARSALQRVSSVPWSLPQADVTTPQSSPAVAIILHIELTCTAAHACGKEGCFWCLLLRGPD